MMLKVKDLDELAERIRTELANQNIALENALSHRTGRSAELRIRGQQRALNWVLDQIEGST